MLIPNLEVEIEFDLMANYQCAIESKCTIIENAPEDDFRYSLVNIVEPIPSYIEYLNGHDFEESTIVMSSNNIEQLIELQNKLRTQGQ